MEAPSDSSTVLELEKEAPSLVTKPFWDMAIPFNSASCSPLEKNGIDTGEESGKKSTRSNNLNIVGAILFLLLSIVVGLVLYVWGSKTWLFIKWSLGFKYQMVLVFAVLQIN